MGRGCGQFVGNFDGQVSILGYEGSGDGDMRAGEFEAILDLATNMLYCFTEVRLDGVILDQKSVLRF